MRSKPQIPTVIADFIIIFKILCWLSMHIVDFYPLYCKAMPNIYVADNGRIEALLFNFIPPKTV
ncbi:hypothetical protein AL515_08370 [Citrobacter sp. FDAARGOS_156]|nr:hypothetical protein AL515_08370 [Citrobacter sp. FDAARGOS_156]AYL60778.1 hypothetical protein CUC49_03525 [Citrobacter pasteurii]